MSYEIVKGIKIEDKKVYVNSHSNNDTAKSHYWLCDSLTKILNEKGETELDIEILKAYEGGDFQSSINNKYTRALKVLYYMLQEEYKKFSWRNEGDKYEQANLLRKTQAFKDLLLKALNTKLPKEKFIVYNPLNSVYVKKTTSRHIFFTAEKENAKQYDFKAQAEELLKNRKEYEVIQI